MCIVPLSCLRSFNYRDLILFFKAAKLSSGLKLVLLGMLLNSSFYILNELKLGFFNDNVEVGFKVAIFNLLTSNKFFLVCNIVLLFN